MTDYCCDAAGCCNTQPRASASVSKEQYTSGRPWMLVVTKAVARRTSTLGYTTTAPWR